MLKFKLVNPVLCALHFLKQPSDGDGDDDGDGDGSRVEAIAKMREKERKEARECTGVFSI